MGKVVTVTGEMDSDNLGVTQTHEHLQLDVSYLVDFVWENNDIPWNITEEEKKTEITFDNLRWAQEYYHIYDNYRLNNVDVMVKEMERYKQRGGESIVCPTPYQVNRDAKAVREISKRSGVNVIMGCGYIYNASHPDDMDEKTPESIADEIISDIEEGMDGTDIRSGIIGEIGASVDFESQPNEKKSFRGAAIAQQETGAPILIHIPLFEQITHDVLDVLEDAGANMEKVIVAHMDGTIRDENGLEYHKSIADRGPYIEFDYWSRTGYWISLDNVFPLDETRIDHIRELFDQGYEDSVLISNDNAHKLDLKKYAGFGYDNIRRNIIPRMKQKGFTSDEITQLVEKNPRSALEFFK